MTGRKGFRVTTIEVRALANNDVAFVAWNPGGAIEGCLGFCVERIDLDHGTRTTLPSWTGWEDEHDAQPHRLPDGRIERQRRTTDVWPVQKFVWRDLTARHGTRYRYAVTPMLSDGRGGLRRSPDTGTSNEIVLTPLVSPNIACWFNRGILATQALNEEIPLAKNAKGEAIRSAGALKKRLLDVEDPLRRRLAGDLLGALMAPIAKAQRDSGSCLAALYELNDPDLVCAVQDKAVHLILTNTGEDDRTNAQSRAALHASGALGFMLDRYVPPQHIGHNKFVVLRDAGAAPTAVLTGSTNWTWTGVCGQSNHAILIQNAGLAAAYADYWERLKADTLDSHASKPVDKGNAQEGPQREALRTFNRTHPATVVVDEARITAWFSPNTEAYAKSTATPPPADMAEVFEAIANARQGILYLLFEPGAPSVAGAIAQAKKDRPALFVRGAATSKSPKQQFDTVLFHRDAPDVDIVTTAKEVQDDFGYWTRELLKAGVAVIHSKIVVIDPMSEEPVVIVGSHNLGYRASCNNDENLLIVRGHRALAHAYAVNVMDVYDHYRWRFRLQNDGDKAYQGLARDPAAWQARYFTRQGPPTQEVAFWLGA